MDQWYLFTAQSKERLQEYNCGLFADEVWEACKGIVLMIGAITPFVQPLDMAFNHVLKKQIHNTHKFAQKDDRLKRYFVTRTGSAKAGHIFTIALCLKEVLCQLFPIYESQSLLKTAFQMAGYHMQLEEKASDNIFLRNVFKHNVDSPPPGARAECFRGIDIPKDSFESSIAAGRTPGRKPNSPGLRD